jgi:hypothetical protein
MKVHLAPFGLLLALSIASAQSPDSTHSIRFSTILSGDVIGKIAAEMTRQNIAVTSESPHAVLGTPLDAPDIQIRVNVSGASEMKDVVVISAVGVAGGGGFTFQGTGSSSAPSVFPIDRGTHRGKEWKRIEELAAALRLSLGTAK